MKKALLIEDLEYLYSKLVKHPLFAVNEGERTRFDTLFHTNITNYHDFLSAATQLTCFFCDGHTNDDTKPRLFSRSLCSRYHLPQTKNKHNPITSTGSSGFPGILFVL